MSNDKLQPYADLKYKSRTYTDKDGNEKGVWVTLGTLFSTPHGSHQTIKLDTVPVGEFNGWISVFPREEPKDKNEQTHEFNKKITQDVAQDEVTDEPLNFNSIPF